jgi:ribosome-associated translation inhibitor RaiA
MGIRIIGTDIELSEPFRAFTERRLKRALAGIAHGVSDVDVRLVDVNGPRGGIDKLCKIKLVHRWVGTILVRATGEDGYATVDGAVSKVAAALRRRLGRNRSTFMKRHRMKWRMTPA